MKSANIHKKARKKLKKTLIKLCCHVVW